MKSSAIATTSTGNENSTISTVAAIDHVKGGIRSIVMPGARRRAIVARMHAAQTLDAVTDRITAKVHRFIPVRGETLSSDSGVYETQPLRAAPWSVRKPLNIITPPSANIQ